MVLNNMNNVINEGMVFRDNKWYAHCRVCHKESPANMIYMDRCVTLKGEVIAEAYSLRAPHDFRRQRNNTDISIEGTFQKEYKLDCICEECYCNNLDEQFNSNFSDIDED